MEETPVIFPPDIVDPPMVPDVIVPLVATSLAIPDMLPSFTLMVPSVSVDALKDPIPVTIILPSAVVVNVEEPHSMVLALIVETPVILLLDNVDPPSVP